MLPQGSMRSSADNLEHEGVDPLTHENAVRETDCEGTPAALTSPNIRSYPRGVASALLESEPSPSIDVPHHGSDTLTRAPTAFGEEVGDSVNTTELVGVLVGVLEGLGEISDGAAEGLLEYRGEDVAIADAREDEEDTAVGSSDGAMDVPTVAVDV